MKCEVCQKDFDSYRQLSYHVINTHKLSTKDYYNLYCRRDSEGFCECCGKELPFLKLSKPFNKTCSRTCASKNEKTKLRREETNIQKFGVKNPFQNENVKQNISLKLIENYGGRGLGSTNIATKIKMTNQEKYNTDNPWKSDRIIHKLIQQRNIRVAQFEVENDCTERQKLIELYGQSWLSIENELDSIWLDGNHKFIKNYELPRVESFGPKFCRHTLNSLEVEIYKYVKSIYLGEIRQNDRQILNKKELDIYLPELKLGIEIDGDYWHSNLYKKKDFHFQKSELCRKLRIRLVHIQEYIWRTNKDMYKAYLSNLVQNRNYFEFILGATTLDYNFGLPDNIDNYEIDNFLGPTKLLDVPNFEVYGCGYVIYKRNS